MKGWFVASSFESRRRRSSEVGCGFFIYPLIVQALWDTLDRIKDDQESAHCMGRQESDALEWSFNFQNEPEMLNATTRELLAA